MEKYIHTIAALVSTKLAKPNQTNFNKLSFLNKCPSPTRILNWALKPVCGHTLPDDFFKSYQISPNILSDH